MSMDPFIAFDLDGTLAVDTGRYDVVGPPVESMVTLAKEYLAEGFQVRIVTARAAPEWGERDTQITMIEDWCEEHIGQRLTVQAHKTGGMIRLYDDRAIGVIHNTGRLLHEEPSTTSVGVAAFKVVQTFLDRTGIQMDLRVAEAIAYAVLTKEKQ